MSEDTVVDAEEIDPEMIDLVVAVLIEGIRKIKCSSRLL